MPATATANLLTEIIATSWGDRPDPAGDVYFCTPVAMARDQAGHVYVADLGNSRIVKLDAAGRVLGAFGGHGTAPGRFNLPFGVAVDREGNVLVADSGNHRIQKFDRNMRHLKSWGGEGAGPGRFGLAREIAVDSRNRYYVTDEYNHRVQVFDSDGSYLYQFGSYGYQRCQFRLPQGIAIDADDNVYVADCWNHRIQKLTARGEFLAQIGSTDTSGDSPNLLQFPRGIGIDAQGNVLVVDTYNHKVKKYGPDLNYLYTIGDFPEPLFPNQVLAMPGGVLYVSDSGNSQLLIYNNGRWRARLVGARGAPRSEPGQFSAAGGAVAGLDGRIYISDRFNHRVQVFDADGRHLDSWGRNGGADGYRSSGSAPGEFNMPAQLAVDRQGRIYVADTLNHRIQIFDPDGRYLGGFGRLGIFAGRFVSPTGVAVDRWGNVFVADWGNDRIQKFDSRFRLVRSWGTSGTGNGQFRRPYEVAVDDAGNVYVADTRNSRVQKFDNHGYFITKWGTHGGNARADVALNSGRGDGELFLPLGIRVAGDFVYVSDSSNHRLQKFDLDGNFIGRFGGFGGGAGQLFTPNGIAISRDGGVYVTDLLLQRVLRCPL